MTTQHASGAPATQPPRTPPKHVVERWTVGTTRITRVAEIEVMVPPGMILPGVDEAAVRSSSEALGPHATHDGRVGFAVNTFVIDTGDAVALVDGGIGRGKQRSFGLWTDFDSDLVGALERAGYPTSSIDLVIATHLHYDHVGWFCSPTGHGWEPTFPDARHVIHEDDFHHWRAVEGGHDGSFADSIEPLVRAGMIDLVGDDARPAPGVSLLASHGHSPGHLLVVVGSGTDDAIVTGDLVHHPLQILDPDRNTSFDHDPARAIADRRAVFARFADTGALVLGSHFSTPAAVRLSSAPGGWRYVPVPGDAAWPEPPTPAGPGVTKSWRIQ